MSAAREPPVSLDDDEERLPPVPVFGTVRTASSLDDLLTPRQKAARAYREAHWEEIAARKKAYREANLEALRAKARVYARERSARLKAAREAARKERERLMETNPMVLSRRRMQQGLALAVPLKGTQ